MSDNSMQRTALRAAAASAQGDQFAPSTATFMVNDRVDGSR
jgi:hypothetical protein